jgi:hypothetical protein
VQRLGKRVVTGHDVIFATLFMQPDRPSQPRATGWSSAFMFNATPIRAKFTNLVFITRRRVSSPACPALA